MKRMHDDQLVSMYVRLVDEKLVRTRWPDRRFGPDALSAGWDTYHRRRQSAWECAAREQRRRMRVHLRSIVGHDAGPHVADWRPRTIIACFAASWIVVALVMVFVKTT